MDFTQLETKLSEIKKRKESLREEIQKSRKNLSTIENVFGSEWWYSTNYSYNVLNDGEKLQVDLPEKQHLYLSYKENNVNFSIAPNYPINVDGTKITCKLNGKASDTLKVTLHVIGYKAGEKIKFYKVQLNTEETFEMNKGELDSFRIAVKLEGKGYFQLESVKLGAKLIPGFQELDTYEEEEVINPVLTLDRGFDQTMEVSLEKLNVPVVFNSYVEKQGMNLKVKAPDGKYAYLQNGNERLFEFSGPAKEINPTSYYEFGLAATTIKNASIELVIVGHAEGTPVEVKAVPNNSKQLIKFTSNTSSVKLLYRVQGEGTISSLKVGISEKPRKSTFEMKVKLHEDEWFIPKNAESKMHTQAGNLEIKVDLPGGKTGYISYQEKNISFSKVPKESAFTIKENAYYEVIPSGEVTGAGTITPIIITYSEDKKEEILNLKWNEVNKIQFKENIRYCRLAFKVTGTTQGKVKEFAVSEFPIMETTGEMEWLDSKEVSMLGLVPKKELSKVKMAAIFDEFTTQCFANECQLITFTPDNWKEVLTAAQPDLLIVESAWRGNNGAWVKKVQYLGEDSIKDLKELLSWCKENTIPTVFWNKEDPVHYNQFIETAKNFDFVLTTDKNMVPVYKEACGHDRVDFLQFAAQPAIHNPITIGERENAVSFAGSYYAKHVERSEDMLRIFNTALPYGLAIYDRNYEKVKQGLLPNNRFPEHLEPFVRGSLKYYEIDKAYKGFKVMININTVKNSPTMFARRVYEALACGTPTVSNYSEGIDHLFGDLVCVSESDQDLKAAFERLFKNEKEYRRITVEGIRRVLKEHTYSERLEKIVDLLQLPYEKVSQSVVVIGQADSKQEIKSLIEKFHQQTYENKRLLVICPEELTSEENNYEHVQLYSLDTFVQSYSNVVEIVDCDYLAVMNPKVEYAETHLLDLMLATKYAPWEIITVDNSETLKFEQLEDADMALSIVKPSLFAVMSSEETIDFLTKDKDISYLKARGARILGITTY
ncbi:CgeB family protein [Neobacillus vireti]|uniref:CgeB family protein n=1 Tax=Neobacillus vireti TaxID=220686 RepID=UPI0030009094